MALATLRADLELQLEKACSKINSPDQVTFSRSTVGIVSDRGGADDRRCSRINLSANIKLNVRVRLHIPARAIHSGMKSGQEKARSRRTYSTTASIGVVHRFNIRPQ
jgi:hypothetical protein